MMNTCMKRKIYVLFVDGNGFLTIDNTFQIKLDKCVKKFETRKDAELACGDLYADMVDNNEQVKDVNILEWEC